MGPRVKIGIDPKWNRMVQIWRATNLEVTEVSDMLGTTKGGVALESGEDGLLHAGSRVPAGRYVRTDVAWGRVLTLDREDWLPASLDGRVALYRRLPTGRALQWDGAR